MTCPSAFVLHAIPLVSRSLHTRAVTSRKPFSRLRRQSPRAQLDAQPPPDSTMIAETAALDPSSGSIIVPPSFTLAGTFMFTGGFWAYLGDGWLVAAVPVLLLGVLLSVQTFRVRFIFGPTKFSVAKRTGSGLEIIRGWEYKQFKNWEVWWKNFPILAYFRELESYGGRGSVHFFPMVCEGRVLFEEMKKRTPHIDKSNK